MYVLSCILSSLVTIAWYPNACVRHFHVGGQASFLRQLHSFIADGLFWFDLLSIALLCRDITMLDMQLKLSFSMFLLTILCNAWLLGMHSITIDIICAPCWW